MTLKMPDFCDETDALLSFRSQSLSC